MKANSYKSEICSAILSTQINTGNQIVINKKIDSIKVIPVVKLSFSENDRRFSKFNFSTDSEFDLCVVSYPSEKIYTYNIRKKQLGLKGQSSNDIKELIKKALQYSSQPIFTFFFDQDRYQNDVICYSPNTCLYKFFISPFSQVLSIEETLKRKFGSSGNYFEYREKETVKNHISKEAIKLFSDTTLRDNWHFYTHYFPNDTVTCISLLTKEIKASIDLSPKDISAIKSKIFLTLANKPPPFSLTANEKTLLYYKYFGLSPIINFMEADITNALASILSSDQMKTYKITSEISYLQNSLIEKSLYNRFKGNLSEKDDFVKKNIKRIGLRSYTFKDENYIKTAVVK